MEILVGHATGNYRGKCLWTFQGEYGGSTPPLLFLLHSFTPLPANNFDEGVPKAAVKEAIFNHHYAAMTEEIAKMTKLEPVKNDDFRKMQGYFKDKSIENGRMSFRIRTQMLHEIPGNFKNKFKNDKEKLKCNHCASEQIMTQSHCMDCSAWSDIRNDLDLSKIDDLVKFFRRLLAERAKTENDGLNKNKPHCTTPAPGGNSGYC